MYGKIASITKGGDTTTLLYSYDPGGNRISKSIVHAGDTLTTWYVRDAQGNVMSVYTYGDPSVRGKDLTQTELHIYGSSRLGLLKMNTDVERFAPANTATMPLLGSGDSLIFTRGNKLFELTNHLGNVMATVSDKRYGVSLNDSTVVYYNSEIVSAQDYYPFGMMQPYRNYTESGVGNYRYGFNGKENDNEVKGVGDQVDYGMRTYDPRIGKFLSMDPLTRKYPELTPYQYASNTPIQATDLDGKEGWELNSEQARLKQVAEAMVAKLNNKWASLPPPHPQPTISATNPTEMERAKSETARREVLNRMYNSDASFSIQIFNGMGAAASVEYPEAGATLHSLEYLKDGNVGDALDAYSDKLNATFLRSRSAFSGYLPVFNKTFDLSKGELMQLRGAEYEKYLHKKLGGMGNFVFNGREFDGAYGLDNNLWYEAKSGDYFKDMNGSQLEKFKSDMGRKLHIANEMHKSYELFSENKIPDDVKKWLTSKGIKYHENYKPPK